MVYAIDAMLFPVGLLAAFAIDDSPYYVALLTPLFGVLAVFASERRVRLEQLTELNGAYRGTAMVLAEVVDADDAYTGMHTRDVVDLSLEVADRMGLGSEQRRKVEFGALLHDVGKVAIPNEIINKPGPLNDAEWAIMRTHTAEGQRMLDRVGGTMSEVGAIVRGSHERWDGGGYPDGLKGDAIPLEARIICACDAYNAMTTTRSTGRRWRRPRRPPSWCAAPARSSTRRWSKRCSTCSASSPPPSDSPRRIPQWPPSCDGPSSTSAGSARRSAIG